MEEDCHSSVVGATVRVRYKVWITYCNVSHNKTLLG